MTTNAPEIARRLHVKNDMTMGWNTSENSFITLEHSIIVDKKIAKFKWSK